MTYNVVDLFCGSGGFSYGFYQAGFNIILGIDNDTNKLKTYHHNFSKLPNSSINTLSINDLQNTIYNVTNNLIRTLTGNKKIDVLIGSPPCKTHSAQNFKKNTNKDLLSCEFIRLVLSIKPKFFLMENVKGLFTHPKTLFTDYFYFILKNNGYTLQLSTLNSVDFGIPQSRERCFLIGNTIGEYVDIDKYKTTNIISIGDAISDLAYENKKNITTYKMKPKSEYQKLMRINSKLLYNHITPTHNENTIKLINKMLSNEVYHDNFKKNRYSNSYNIVDYDKPANTIVSRLNISNSPVLPNIKRCLSPREAARIQSFDDRFEFIGKKNQISQQIGDAVPPLLAKIIADEIQSILIKRTY